MSRRWKTVKVNLVERPEWKDYDTTDRLGTYISEQVATEMSGLHQNDIVSLAQDVALSPPREAYNLLRVLAERGDTLYAAWKRWDRSIETFMQMVQDSSQYAWEEELIPDKYQTNEAVKETIQYFGDHWHDWISNYDRLWELFEYMGGDQRERMRTLLARYVDFEQKEGYYDRYLVFDPEGPYRMLTKEPLPVVPEGVFEWTPPPEISQEEIAGEIGSLLEEIREPFIERVFKELKDAMDLEPSPAFQKHWKKLLKDDPKTVKIAKQELKEFLEGVEKDR